MGYTVLEDLIEIEPISNRKYNSNIHTLVNLRTSLINTLEASKHFVTQSESFVASTFLLASDLNRIGLQFPDISSLSSSLTTFNKKVNQQLPHTIKECKFLLDYSNENQIPFDHSEIFKGLKQEIDKFLVDSNLHRKELKSLLLKYSKSSSESTSDKIASTMAKLNQSIFQYEKYLYSLETELSEFCIRKHDYLFHLSKNIISLHQLIHSGKKADASNQQDLKPTLFLNNSNLNYNNNVINSNSLPPQTFKDILDNPFYLKAFRIFAEKQHCLENLLFWLDANTIKDLEADQYPRNKVRNLYLNMYNNYIQKDCQYEINIDSESKLSIDNRKKEIEEDSPFYPSLQLAVDNVYQILNLSMFPLFLSSSLYQSATMLNKPPPQDNILNMESRGIFHCINSIESLLRNPITIEYFLLFLKQNCIHPTTPPTLMSHSGSSSNLSSMLGGSSGSSSSSSTPNNSQSPRSVSPSTSFSSLGLVPPITISLSPRLAPLISPFSLNQNTHNEIVNMIYFYLEISKFKDLTEDQLDTYAIEIYDNFLKPGCDKQITSISYHQVQDMISSKSVTKDMFKNACQDILLHIANNYFQPFLNSNLCKEMLQREEKMKKYIDREEKKTKQDSKLDQQFEYILKEKFKLILPSTKNSTSSTTSSGISLSTSGGSSGGLSISGGSNSGGSSITNTNTNSSNSKSHSKSNSSSSSNYLSPNLISNSSSSSSSTTDKIKSIFSPSFVNLSLIGGNGSSSNSSIPQSPSLASGTVSPRNDDLHYLGQGPPSPHILDEPNEILNFILTDNQWLDAFKKFVKNEKSEEILLFWLEVDSFLKKKDKNVRMVQNIYETFVCDGSPLEVNIEYEIRTQIRTAIRQSSYQYNDGIEEALKAASQSVLEMIRVGSYKNFLKSPLFKEYSSSLGDPYKKSRKINNSK
ncbi:hypothetical protein DICPUDRAFT_95497 [Dictyostelium purpureum]|uniref:RGS domain-containing protein n=1 Tax=Dictyostelium purpureum TaxID=5786 RepID=F0ZWX8_DICPU|nr:uncharacterized protein DICPUDRAFT_95497 [Dictyostelium purpureum]EGC31554.1 hypothetical protein DICPUDRAFT_95497 [Dictyostelium purpureum]|eukprot:XP_003291925.1 hypothetical protein DICPUDRAFT_95497 [Dictyostelium purpureum]